MGCCTGEEPERNAAGVIKDRKCRDVLCILLFVVFWIGMFIICIVAYRQGDARRVVYGIDSYGLTCGAENSMSWQINTSLGSIYTKVTLDFSSQKSVYYLNPLQLLSISSIPYAKKICVNSCPDDQFLCGANLPCTEPKAFRCTYAAFAQYNLSGKVPGVAVTDSAYYSNLAAVGSVNDSSAAAFINSLNGMQLPWVNQWLASNNISAGSNVSGAYYQLTSQFPNKGPCNPVYSATTDFFHTCVPKFGSNFTDKLVQNVDSVLSKVPDSAKNAFNDLWNSWSQRFSRDVSDLQKAILIIVVAGLLSSFVLCAVWLVILRYLAGVMAWLTIIVLNLALLGVTLYCFSLAGLLGSSSWAQDLKGKLSDIGDPMSVDQQAWKAIAITAAVISGLVFILTLLMISRIRIAVACIKVASQAVGQMPSILFFPMFPFILEVFLVVYWVAVTAMLYTAGDLSATCRAASDFKPYTFSSIGSLSAASLMPVLNNATSGGVDCYSNLSGQQLQTACGDDPNCYLSYKWNNKLRYAFVYHLFGLLWTNQVIVGISCVTIAGSIGSYYWSGGDSAKMPTFPVLVAMKNTFIYQIGSIMFAAIIIALIQLIRLILEFLDRQSQNLQAMNKCAEWAMCCCKCCCWCLEKIVAFINRNAYIIMAIKGTSYCDSAITAAKLIITNALRLVTVTIIGDILLLLGKLTVCALCALIAFAMTDLQYYSDAVKYPDTYLSSPVWPIVICAMIGFVVAEIFFSVYEMAIDTIMLSFCEDCESNGGNPKWAPPLLMEAMGQDANKREHPAPAAKGNAVAPQPGPPPAAPTKR